MINFVVQINEKEMGTIVIKLIETGEYDKKAIAKFHAQKVKQMERQNAKILASPSLQKSYSICDPIFFADQQVRQYLHTFKIFIEKRL